ncbi:TonB-dependent receptor [Winogradskyella aurantiaca]|uniref:TonB-dependent receptor n=1 Tax=Winogradskyella aurantiaca TaxID=2219558 RepID=UPI000E1CDA5C|nr:TonB-dependent receptor [Winogradskyella aurantiaca]
MKSFIAILLIFSPWILKAQNTGEIFGRVLDEKNIPVAGASVLLENTIKGAQTDIDGRYLVTGIEPGSYNLIVSYLGYETQTKYNILVKSKGNPSYDFILKESAETLDVVVISSSDKISRPKETPLSTQSLSANEIANYPGSNNDVVQVAQTLPGVSPSVGGFRNDLIIRGGAANETVYYLDGMEVPNINHFSTQGSAGGPVGMVNVSFISDVTLSSSAFGAQYDNPLSGVLQFDQRNGNPRNFNGNFRISASEAALTLEGPLFKGQKEESKTTVLASVRRSYLQFLFELIGLPFRPNYWDYQYKVRHEINAYNSISLIGLGSIDEFSVAASSEEFDPVEQAQLEQAPFINQRTNAIGLTWKNRFKNGTGFMQTTLSQNMLNNEFTRYENPRTQENPFFINDSRETETKLRYALTKFFKDWKVNTGLNLQYSDYQNRTRNLVADDFFNSEIDFVKYGFFGNVTNTFFNNKLDVSFGFRMDADTFLENSNLLDTFSPRLSLSYEFIENWRLNGSIGRYYKIPPYTILGFRDNDGSLVNSDAKYTLSDHYVLGVEYFLNPSAAISVEGFYKAYDDYPVSIRDEVSLANKGADFEVLGSEPIATVGRGRSYGLEFQFQQKLTRNFFGIFSYTYFFSEFTSFNRDVFVPSVWDSRHLISFVGGYKLKRNWEVSSRYRFAGQTPFVPTDIEATTITYPNIVLDYSRLDEQKLGVFSQLDIRIDKKWNFKRSSLNLFFEVQNILAQNAPSPPLYGLNRDENGTIIPPRTLVELEQDNSQPIPSLGIVFDF